MDRTPRTPKVLRRLQSARTPEMLKGNPPRAFTGVYEFDRLRPDTPYTVTVQTEEGEAEVVVRTLPAEVPRKLDQWFNVLLVSCFHQTEDPTGLAGELAAELKKRFRLHMTLLLGDQVYLDLPTLQDFPDNLQWLAEKFEQDYVRNWRGPRGFPSILSAAPSISIPDDHEYWNNFPHKSPFIGNTHTGKGRDRWRKAAKRMYESFQLPGPERLGASVILDVPPLSFFMADTRTRRDSNRQHSLSPGALQQLHNWVTRLERSGLFGVFVSGQSVFAEAAGGVGGAVGDYELPNYRDFPDLVKELVRPGRGGREIICITGDVHWGRVAQATHRYTGRPAIYEVISSPSSLVTTIGTDQIRRIGSSLRAIFGHRDPWPRHADPDPVSEFFAFDVLRRDFGCSVIHPQTGNHVVLLSFRQARSGLDVSVGYWPIHKDHDVRREHQKTIGPLRLSRRS